MARMQREAERFGGGGWLRYCLVAKDQCNAAARRPLYRAGVFARMRHAIARRDVMLHLRARYVSKAAIFIDAGTSPAGRKSKSRLNSKGLDR